jgi:Ca2+:H+ antiporter
MAVDRNPAWTWCAPLAACLALAGRLIVPGDAYLVVLGLTLGGAVLAAVHHAEVIAHRVGEPFGTLLLALAVTVIEVGLIVSLMMAGGSEAAALPRDTIFAAVMLILNGILGLCLLVGGLTHREQRFDMRGVNATLAVLGTLLVLTLILPNFTTTVPGPYYSHGQLVTVAVVSLALYATFLLVQTVRHRDYFLPEGPAVADEHVHAPQPTPSATTLSAVLLVVALVAVVLLAKSIAPALEHAVDAFGAPTETVGVLIAALVLLPESMAAVRAARANRVQTSLNLALGSAVASTALTIPTVAFLSLYMGWELSLGLDGKSMVLLALSLFVGTLSLSTGRTTVLQGAVHLVIFAVYLATTLIP